MTRRIWFQGTARVTCDAARIDQALADIGSFFSKTVAGMPGISKVSTVDRDGATYRCRTNEGEVQRSAVSIEGEGGNTRLQFEETYDARLVVVRAHHRHSFESDETGTTIRVEISNVSATGLLGFAYKLFGSKSIGKAILAAYQDYFDAARQSK